MHDSHTSILIVDDVPANLQLLSDILKEHGYKVRPAPSGALALEAARRVPPDLVLLDINMPDMDGIEVCRRLKQDPNLSEIPVLFISALGDETDKVRAFDSGGQDYVTKPFQVEEVLARVRTHLSLRKAQQEVKAQNDALREVLDQLRQAQDQLIMSEKMAALGVLAAGIAHEINNPLNFMKTSVHGLEKDIQDLTSLVEFCRNVVSQERAEALAAKESAIDYPLLTEEIPHLLGSILGGLVRASDIVASLQVFTRTDEALTKDIDFNELVESMLMVLHNRCKERVSISTQFTKLPPLEGNRGKLGQVVMNLLNNAIDAVETIGDPAARSIVLKTEPSMRDGRFHVALHVSDNGPGIPEDIRNRIFDPFFTTKPVGKGTGLGLFICNTLVQEHHGVIKHEPNAGRGTTFSIYLPVTRESTT